MLLNDFSKPNESKLNSSFAKVSPLDETSKPDEYSFDRKLNTDYKSATDYDDVKKATDIDDGTTTLPRGRKDSVPGDEGK